MIVRRDITPVNHTKRGNIQNAILASYGTNRKRTHDDLTRDFYAPSCHDSRQSIWNTWCTIAKAWDLLPIPITDELVLAVGASLKNGGYRSSKNFFSRAMQEHRDQCINPLPASTLALIAKVTRSINRGIGPTTLKVHEKDPGVWYLHRDSPGHHYNLLLVALARHRSSRRQDAPCMATSHQYRQHHILHITYPKERHNRHVRQQRPQLCVWAGPYKPDMPTLCDDPTW